MKRNYLLLGDTVYYSNAGSHDPYNRVAIVVEVSPTRVVLRVLSPMLARDDCNVFVSHTPIEFEEASTKRGWYWPPEELTR